jgi:hypothetical protein
MGRVKNRRLAGLIARASLQRLAQTQFRNAVMNRIRVASRQRAAQVYRETPDFFAELILCFD